jgi:hypothetical protein
VSVDAASAILVVTMPSGVAGSVSEALTRGPTATLGGLPALGVAARLADARLIAAVDSCALPADFGRGVVGSGASACRARLHGALTPCAAPPQGSRASQGSRAHTGQRRPTRQLRLRRVGSQRRHFGRVNWRTGHAPPTSTSLVRSVGIIACDDCTPHR